MKILQLVLECNISNKLSGTILEKGLQNINTAILRIENKKAYLKRARILPKESNERKD